MIVVWIVIGFIGTLFACIHDSKISGWEEIKKHWGYYLISVMLGVVGLALSVHYIVNYRGGQDDQ